MCILSSSMKKLNRVADFVGIDCIQLKKYDYTQ